LAGVKASKKGKTFQKGRGGKANTPIWRGEGFRLGKKGEAPGEKYQAYPQKSERPDKIGEKRRGGEGSTGKKRAGGGTIGSPEASEHRKNPKRKKNQESTSAIMLPVAEGLTHIQDQGEGKMT